ncbi:FG-GAP-like repeat-containing protein [Streptomyces sp. NPDC058655]|uniref:FG-GAP-like repeat-containing protein n=1 Tax=Streptomyces sp. NPDC058655 TaxID=3346577 RepID=UPI003652E5CF
MPDHRPRTVRVTSLLVTATAVTAGLVSGGPALAVTGPEAPTGRLSHTLKLSIGDEANSRACTASLVDEWWIATAASCFAGTPGQRVPAGKPALAAFVTLADGRTLTVAELAPREDRDLVLARLVLPARGAAVVKTSATAPAAGAELTSAGFGRTKTEWVPGKLHTGTFTVNSADATTLAVTGKGTDALCKGDTGGPLLNAAGELVGINSRSWQGGCLGVNPAETRTGAIAARTGDIAQWIAKTIEPRRSAAVNEAGGSGRVRWADFDGDGKPDYVTVADNGAVSVWLNHGGDPVGAAGWQPVGQVASGTTTDRSRVRLVDFDGDGKFDYVVINPDGTVNVWLNRGGDQVAPWQEVGQVASGVTADASKVRFADWDGDGRSDYLVFDDGGALDVHLNRGGDKIAPWQPVGRVTTGSTTDRSRVRFADNDGDGKADYHLVKADGKVDLYRNRGGDVVPNTGWEVAGQIASGVTTDHTKVQFVDFTADTHADYILADKDTAGSATVYGWNGGDKGNGWTNVGKVAHGGV